MARKIIQMPVSGRDRRHFKNNLGQARGVYESASKQAAEARAEAFAAMRRANYLECEAWSAWLFMGGEYEPSPTIAEALNARVELLEVKCGRCGHADKVDLAEVVWPREKQVHTLAGVLFCRPCRANDGRTSRPALIALRTRMPSDPDAPPRAARGR